MFSIANDHILSQIDKTPIINQPYTYIEIDNFFPPWLYQKIIDQRIPTDCLFTLKELKRVGKGYSDSRQVINLTPKLTILPDDIRSFWEGFTTWMQVDVRQFLLTKFDIADKELHADLLYTRDTKNYSLGPHTDNPKKVLTSLFYIPQSATHTGIGTSIYTPKINQFSCPGGRHHDFENFDMVRTIPYVPNKMFAFVKSNVSFHGVENVDVETERDLIIYDFQRINYE